MQDAKCIQRRERKVCNSHRDESITYINNYKYIIEGRSYEKITEKKSYNDREAGADRKMYESRRTRRVELRSKVHFSSMISPDEIKQEQYKEQRNGNEQYSCTRTKGRISFLKRDDSHGK